MKSRWNTLRENLAKSALRVLGFAGVGLVILGSILITPIMLAAAWLTRYLMVQRMNHAVVADY